VHDRNADCFSRSGRRFVDPAAHSDCLVPARGADSRRAGQHAAGGRRLLPVGGSRFWAVLGISEWLAHLDLLARGYGAVSRPVQSVYAVSCAGRASVGMAHRVGRVSIAAGSFVMLGFLVMSVCAVPRIVRVPWEPFASENVHGLGGLALGISIGLWNYIGWDNASTAQGEVRDASRSYPRALALALPFVTLGYLVPLIVALGATN